MLQKQWQIKQLHQIPQELINIIKTHTGLSNCHYTAQLLCQRGIVDREKIPGFLNPDYYQPTSPFAFQEEMTWAVARLNQSFISQEKITIWGDFDADGITATSVLWEGLGQFVTKDKLDYYIPHRERESHGLNNSGIDKLAKAGTKLIVTCDTGSTNLTEIAYANQLGIDIIITDHHTLPEKRPEVVAIINPRYLPEIHPLFYLSGVAVAYKLIEALYQEFPNIPQQPLEELLDLVGIGLIADLVSLSGDCRYLAQKGIRQLQKQSNPDTAKRPGITSLLELCKKSGDRPTDISFGLAPRINAISRIQGDASFCIELLTSRDAEHCKKLAEETELANQRRKFLQKQLTEQVKKKLARIDLSTTKVIVLEDSQWQSGILGLVANEIAQEYNRPTILLTTFAESGVDVSLARGSARSINNIDLYQLVKSQSHLLHKFGGHPFAAGLSLNRENIPIFREAINQQARCQYGNYLPQNLEVDLVVTVRELGQNLFKELKLLEPYGMGHTAPKLLIKNCYFTRVTNENIQDFKKNKIQYIKTTFFLNDPTINQEFPGVWWGHYQNEIPQNQACDVIVELDYNADKNRYEIRLVDLKLSANNQPFRSSLQTSILDWREKINLEETGVRQLLECPSSWNNIYQEYQTAIALEKKLALAYPKPEKDAAEVIWQKLIGIAKYLCRTGKKVSKQQLQDKLELSDRTLEVGLKALSEIGFHLEENHNYLQLTFSQASLTTHKTVSLFLETIKEEQFQRYYFYQVPLVTVKDTIASG